jgi:hypothetical protein
MRCQQNKFVDAAFKRWFYKLGFMIGSHPGYFIIVPLLLTALCASGFQQVPCRATFFSSKYNVSKVTMSKGTMSKVKMAKVIMSKVTVSKVTVSKVTVSKVTVSKVTVSKVLMSRSKWSTYF